MPLVALLATVPMAAILLKPAQGLHVQDRLCRQINRHLLTLGVARWMMAVLTLTLAPVSILSALAWFGLIMYTSLWARQQMRGVLAQPKGAGIPAAPSGRFRPAPAAPAPRRWAQAARPAPMPAVVPVPQPVRGMPRHNRGMARPNRGLVMAPATPTGPAGQQHTFSQVSPVQRVEVPNMPPLLCPVCDTPADGTDTACGECGLVFTSRVPAALQALPDYQVLRPLGDGGMSSVYLARKRYGDQLCVLKTLATVDSTSDPHWRAEAARCLRQEADMLRQLDHPNIARMLSWYSGKQTDLLVLEYVPGLTLEQRLTRSDGRGGTLPGAALPPAEALAYGVSMASVLEYLEQQEPPVVHHDIKPANLIVRPDDGRLMLVDFGSALLLPDASSDTVKLDSYGTPGYAAPEQYQGHSSPASDVYSLGATLYHLLTDDDPTAHPLAFPALANLPPQIADVLRPALAREPQQRPTARQLRVALEQALSTV
jgi:hypothetical protein